MNKVHSKPVAVAIRPSLLTLAALANSASIPNYSRADLSPGIVRPFLPDRFDNLAAIARVTSPVVLFHGTADSIIPFAHQRALQDAGARHLMMAVTLEGADHHPSMDRVAPWVWQALTDDVSEDHH